MAFAAQGSTLQTHNVELVKCKPWTCSAFFATSSCCASTYCELVLSLKPLLLTFDFKVCLGKAQHAEGCASAAGIEDLREKREEVHRQLMEEESERQKLTSELQLIQRRLNQINESISRKASFYPGNIQLGFVFCDLTQHWVTCSLLRATSMTRWFRRQRLPT